MAKVGISTEKKDKGVLDRFFMRKDYVDKNGDLIESKEIITIYDLPRTVVNHEFMIERWVYNSYLKRKVKRFYSYYIKCNADEKGRCAACESHGNPISRSLIPIIHINSWKDKKTGEIKRKGIKSFFPIKGQSIGVQLEKALGKSYDKWIGVQLQMGRSDTDKSPSCGDTFIHINAKGTNKPAGKEWIDKISEMFSLDLTPYTEYGFDERAMLIMDNQEMVEFIEQLYAGIEAKKGNAATIVDEDMFGGGGSIVKSDTNKSVSEGFDDEVIPF